MLFYFWQRVRAEPEHWEEQQAVRQRVAPEEMAELAASVEARLPSEWSRPIGSGDGVRQMRVGYDEVNAWLAVRLPQLLENQGGAAAAAAALGDVMLAERDGHLVLAFRYTLPGGGSDVASLYFSFEPGEVGGVEAGSGADPGADPGAAGLGPSLAEGDGSGAGDSARGVGVRLERMTVGRQALPQRLIAGRLLDLLPADLDEARPWLEAAAKGEAVPLPPLPVDGQRSATVQAVEVEPTHVELTLRVAFED